MTHNMKRNIQTTDCHHPRSRSGGCRSVGFVIRQHRVSGFAILPSSGGFVIRQQRVSGFVIRLLLLMLMMTVEATAAWGQISI